MISPDFSEFTFGYAFTENLLNGWLGRGVSGLPVFPSLVEEGRIEGGYDLRVPAFAAPLLIQFKRPQVVTRRSRYLPPGFRCPYYRMHIQPGSKSLQHRALLRHAHRGNGVYYVCARFDQASELESLYHARGVPERCAYIAPTDIGSLTDEAHFVAYEPDGRIGWLFSEPRQLDADISSGSFRASARDIALGQAVRVSEPDLFFSSVADDIVASIAEMVDSPTADEEADGAPGVEHVRSSRDQGLFTYEKLRFVGRPEEMLEAAQRMAEVDNPLRRLANLAAIVLDCQLLVLGHDG